MLFNSYIFLLLFLPVTVVGYFYIAKHNATSAAGWLCAASLFFYGWWDYRYLPLLLGSICFNYWCGNQIRAATAYRKVWLTSAIAINLVLLAYYKYAGFFLDAFGSLTGQTFPSLHILLPIGISFFTFTQIAYLVDTAQGKVRESRFLHYGLFVTYFPHLIAGPVLHHKEMMPQFADPKNYVFSARNFSIGITIFCIGLAKKVLIADNLAPYANHLFGQSGTPSMLVAWGGVLAYTFQLYFDFSGYSGMAIGLSRLFGVRLPLNFNSPYKADSIIEFWRRWHMTLSRFLRDYLYIALGGSKLGTPRRFINLSITMILGGLWHGAGWTFVVWGALHGAYLMINHAWRIITKRLDFNDDSVFWKFFATVITFIAVCFAWVFFRALDLQSALLIIKGMVGGAGIELPKIFDGRLSILGPVYERLGGTFSDGGGARFVETWAWVLGAGIIAFTMPNCQEIMRRFRPALDFEWRECTAGFFSRRVQWRPSIGWAAFGALLTLASLLGLNRPSEFLYFQF